MMLDEDGVSYDQGDGLEIRPVAPHKSDKGQPFLFEAEHAKGALLDVAKHHLTRTFTVVVPDGGLVHVTGETLVAMLQQQATDKPDLSGCDVMVDGEGVQLESGKPFSFTCCDCGLTHRCVFVSADGNPVGFAVERDEQTTENRRAPPAVPLQGQAQGVEALTRCASDGDGDCRHPQCPQLRDNEPAATGRWCPIFPEDPYV